MHSIRMFDRSGALSLEGSTDQAPTASGGVCPCAQGLAAGCAAPVASAPSEQLATPSLPWWPASWSRRGGERTRSPPTADAPYEGHHWGRQAEVRW